MQKPTLCTFKWSFKNKKIDVWYGDVNIKLRLEQLMGNTLYEKCSNLNTKIFVFVR